MNFERDINKDVFSEAFKILNLVNRDNYSNYTKSENELLLDTLDLGKDKFKKILKGIGKERHHILFNPFRNSINKKYGIFLGDKNIADRFKVEFIDKDKKNKDKEKNEKYKILIDISEKNKGQKYVGDVFAKLNTDVEFLENGEIFIRIGFLSILFSNGEVKKAENVSLGSGATSLIMYDILEDVYNRKAHINKRITSNERNNLWKMQIAKFIREIVSTNQNNDTSHPLYGIENDSLFYDFFKNKNIVKTREKMDSMFGKGAFDSISEKTEVLMYLRDHKFDFLYNNVIETLKIMQLKKKSLE